MTVVPLSALLILAAVLAGCSPSRPSPSPERIYVDNLAGDDGRDGRAPAPGAGRTGPVRTIMRALRLARPGAHIELAATAADYRETVRIEGFGLGSADRPLVIQGNGAAITGLLEIPAGEWRHAAGDLYFLPAEAVERLAPDGGMPKSNWLWHWKRTSWWSEPEAPAICFLDGRSAPQAAGPEAIEPGGFHYNVNAKPLRLWFRLPAGRSISQCRIELPCNHGVVVNDDHVVIRNLASLHSSDDGFQTFLASHVVFSNIRGAFNCDQGISLHNATAGVVEGGVFERNGGCGIVDNGDTQCSFLHCTIRDNNVAGALGDASHHFQSCWFTGNRGLQIEVGHGGRATILNCLIQGRTAGGEEFGGIGVFGRAVIDHSTVADCSVGIDGTGAIAVTDSIVARCSQALLGLDHATVAGTLLDGRGSVRLAGRRLPVRDHPQLPRAERDVAGLHGCFIEEVPLPAEAVWQGLPPAHPRSRVEGEGTRRGAVLEPRSGWRPDLPVEVIPSTIFTHQVGRRAPAAGGG